MKTIILVSALLASSCTNAQIQQISSFGRPGKITCYSGGKIILEAESDGKIASEDKSDGWYLKDNKTGKLIRVSGDCVIVN